MLVIALLIDWQVALLSLIVVPFLYWSFGLYGKRIVPRLQRVQQLEWRSLSIVHEAMAMLRVIVSFGREDYEHHRFREQGRRGRRAGQADRPPDPLHARRADGDRGRHRARPRLRRLARAAGQDHDRRADRADGLHRARSTSRSRQISTTVGTLHEQFVQFNASLRPARHRARGDGEARRGRRSGGRAGRVAVRGRRASPTRAASDTLAGHLLRRRGRANGSRSSARPAPARPRS